MTGKWLIAAGIVAGCRIGAVDLATVPKPDDRLPERRMMVQQEVIPPGWVENPFVETTPAPVPTAAEKAAGMLVFSRPLTEPVYAESRPGAWERVTFLHKFGSRGEWVTFHFSLYPFSPLKNLKVRAELNLDTPLRIRQVGYWKLRYPYYTTDRQYRRMPEFMFPVTVSDAPAGEPQRFLVTMRIPEHAAAGMYRGVIRIFHDGYERALALPISLEVFPFRLESDLNKNFSAYNYPIRVAYRRSGKDEAWMRRASLNDYRTMKDYGFTRPPSVIMQYDLNLRKYRIDDLDRMLAEMKEAGLPVPVLLVTGSGESRLYQKHTGQVLKKHMIYETEPPESMYQEMKTALVDFRKECREKNYPPMIFGPIDEPRKEALPMVKRIYQVFKEAGCRTFMTSSPFQLEMEALVDFWSEGSFAVPYAEAVSGRKKEHWCYPNDVAYQIKNPAVMNHGGRMTYGYGFWRSGYHFLMPWVWREFHTERLKPGLTGGGNLVTEDGEIALGLYWECFRQGIDDGRYVYTLQNAIFQREPANDPKLAKLLLQGRALLTGLWKHIPPQPAYLTTGLWPHLEFDGRRLEMARLLEQILKYPAVNNRQAPAVLVGPGAEKKESGMTEIFDREAKRGNLVNWPLTGWRAREREATVANLPDGTTELKIKIDLQHDGTGNARKLYLAGWPRMRVDFPAPGLDLESYQYLSFRMKVDSDRDGETAYDWPLQLEFGSFLPTPGMRSFSLPRRREPKLWHSVLLPLTEVLPTISDAAKREISFFQIYIREGLYQDGAELRFQFRDIKLLSVKTPVITELGVPKRMALPGEVLPWNLKLVGQVPPDRYWLRIILRDAQGKVISEQEQALTLAPAGGIPVSALKPGTCRIEFLILDRNRQVLSTRTDEIQFLK